MLRVEGQVNRKRMQENCYILWGVIVLSGCLKEANDGYLEGESEPICNLVRIHNTTSNEPVICG